MFILQNLLFLDLKLHINFLMLTTLWMKNIYLIYHGRDHKIFWRLIFYKKFGIYLILAINVNYQEKRMLLRGNYILFYTEFFEFLFICQHVLQPQIFSNHLLPYQIYVLDKTDIFILDIRIFMVYYTMNWCINVLRVSIKWLNNIHEDAQQKSWVCQTSIPINI